MLEISNKKRQKKEGNQLVDALSQECVDAQHLKNMFDILVRLVACLQQIYNELSNYTKNQKKVGCKKQKHDFDLYNSSFSKPK